MAPCPGPWSMAANSWSGAPTAMHNADTSWGVNDSLASMTRVKPDSTCCDRGCSWVARRARSVARSKSAVVTRGSRRWAACNSAAAMASGVAAQPRTAAWAWRSRVAVRDEDDDVEADDDDSTGGWRPMASVGDVGDGDDSGEGAVGGVDDGFVVSNAT